jgi:hypothetical protein
MRVLVFSGRDFRDRERVFRALDFYEHRHGPIEIVTGGGRGADAFAREWAEERDRRAHVFHGERQRRTQIITALRNMRMLAEGRPDVALGFPRIRETYDIQDRCEAANIKVVNC